MRDRFVRALSPAPDEEWRQVLASDPRAVAFQTPEWTRAMCEAGPYVDASRLYRRPDGRRLVLPMVRRRELPGRLSIRYSLPVGWGSGGLLAEDGRLEAADLDAVRRDLERSGIGPVVVTPDPAQDSAWSRVDAGWSLTRSRSAQLLDTSGGFEEVWAHRFRSSVRRAVRRAETSSVVVDRDTSGALIEDFYLLYEKSVTRWARQDGVPAVVARWRASRLEHFQKFRVVAKLMGDACVTWVATVDGEPVAGIVVLTQGGNANYWRGAMDLDKAGPVRANDLLHKRAIEEACTSGVRRYSFGISEPGSGLARFKEGFGAETVEYSEYISERLPVMRGADRFRRVARRALERLPGGA